MPVDVSPALDEAAVRACWPVFAQLRPNLKIEEELIARKAYLRAGFHLDCHHLALSLRES
jgi:hypothetical protein